MHASLFTVILLGIVEGLTEFIPVSSTAHLRLVDDLLGVHDTSAVTFNIVIQLGAILAVLVLYTPRFTDVAVRLVRRDPTAVAFMRNVLLGFVPVLIAGALFYKHVKALLDNSFVYAISLIVGGVAILVIERLAKRRTIASVEGMSARTAIGVGLLQCVSLIPGVSRSGATIMGAVSLGVDRRAAAEFSFFLAIPVMLAASAKELWEQRDTLAASEWGNIALGFGVSFFVALVVVNGFVALVSRHGFAPFAWWRIIVGAGWLAWLMAH